KSPDYQFAALIASDCCIALRRRGRGPVRGHMQLSQPPPRSLTSTSYPPKPDAVAGAERISGLRHQAALGNRKQDLAFRAPRSRARARSAKFLCEVPLPFRG